VRLRLCMGKTFPLAAAAHRDPESRASAGKLILPP
jgi:hypothetical protein